MKDSGAVFGSFCCFLSVRNSIGTRLHKHFALLLVTLILIFASTAPILAVPILDQSFDASGNIGLTLSDLQQVAQTFTVGVTGTLTQIGVQIGRIGSPDYDVTLDIRTAPIDGVPEDSLIFATVTIPASCIPSFSSSEFINVDVEAFEIAVNAGDILAITARTDATFLNSYAWMVDCRNIYNKGQAFTRPAGPGADWQSSYTDDAGFRTFIQSGVTASVDPPGATPEAGTFLMLGAGLAGLAGYGRFRFRRKR